MEEKKGTLDTGGVSHRALIFQHERQPLIKCIDFIVNRDDKPNLYKPI